MPSREHARAALSRGAAALGVDFPLVQAGMGGISTAPLAAAVSNAGALGTIALYKTDPEQAAALVTATAAGTPNTFAVNVIPEVAGELLDAQLSAALRAVEGRRIVVNSYGLPPWAVAGRVRAAGHRLLIQVGDGTDAERAAAIGADVIVVQGTEAGGHLLGEHGVERAVRDSARRAGDVPVFAAGGLHTADDLERVVGWGASGMMCGTAFVATAESTAHPSYKAAVVGAGAADTVITDRFDIGWPGRRHRVLRGAPTEAAERQPARLIAWTQVMGTRRPVPLGSAAAPTVDAEGRVEDMARYAGTGCAQVRAVLPAAEVVAAIRAPFPHHLTAPSTVSPRRGRDT
jgi:nitronate monooxygenase